MPSKAVPPNNGRNSLNPHYISIHRTVPSTEHIPGLNKMRPDLLVHVPSGKIMICNIQIHNSHVTSTSTYPPTPYSNEIGTVRTGSGFVLIPETTPLQILLSA